MCFALKELCLKSKKGGLTKMSTNFQQLSVQKKITFIWCQLIMDDPVLYVDMYIVSFNWKKNIV